MIAYCPPNVTLSEVWTKNGISHCFFDTVSTSAIAGFLLIFGSLQLFMYRRYATLIDEHQIRKSKLYNLQIFLSLLVPALAIIRFLFQIFFYNSGKVYGFMVSKWHGNGTFLRQLNLFHSYRLLLSFSQVLRIHFPYFYWWKSVTTCYHQFLPEVMA